MFPDHPLRQTLTSVAHGSTEGTDASIRIRQDAAGGGSDFALSSVFGGEIGRSPVDRGGPYLLERVDLVAGRR